jgi:hypothetical protein
MGFSHWNKLELRDILELCELYDICLDDFEKVLLIEQLMHPAVVKGYFPK